MLKKIISNGFGKFGVYAVCGYLKILVINID